jgi:hypothetical protein
MERPLISYVIATYNQEPFIREAIEGAFAQTYQPLQIVISDDCSRDKTFEIIQQAVAAYRGPHQVQVNRNSSTLGIAGQINRLMALCRGVLVVANAGDDVSVPERTERIFQAWESTERRATSIFSSYTIMSGDGVLQGQGGKRGENGEARAWYPLTGSLEDFLRRKQPVVNGCSHAWSPALFSYFGPLSSDLEDLVLSFRSLAIGQLLYIAEPLVKYRRHEANVSFLAERDDTRSFEHREQRLRWVDEKGAAAYENMLRDLETLCARGVINEVERERLRRVALPIRDRYALERQMMEGGMLQRIGTVFGTISRGQFANALRSVPRALPKPVYRKLYLLRARWRAVP